MDDKSRQALVDNEAERIMKFLDLDNNQRIDILELNEGFKRLNFPLVPAESKRLMEVYDKNKDGHISLEELKLFLSDNMKELKTIFDTIDSNKDGSLSIDEVESTLRLLRRDPAASPSAETVRRMFAQIDANNDGRLSEDEWYHFLLLLPLSQPSHHVLPLDMSADSLNLADDPFSDHLGNIHKIFDYWQTNAMIDFGGINVAAADVGPVEIPPAAATAESSAPVPQTRYQTAIADLIAGGISGAVSKTATAPLDRLRTLQQVLAANPSSLSSSVAPSVGGTTPRIYSNNIYYGLKQMYAEDGFMAFFRGNGLNCIKQVPELACFFFMFEQTKLLLASRRLESSPSSSSAPNSQVVNLNLNEKFIAGAVAGVMAQTLTYPLEVIKTRFSVTTKTTKGYDSITATTLSTLKSGGPSALLRGLLPAVLGVIPFAGVNMMIYETSKAYLSQHLPTTSPAIPFASGIAASVTAQFVAFPLIVVRTRAQAHGLGSFTGGSSRMADIIRSTIANEGLRGFYRGFGASLAKVLPASSISYTTYEMIRRKVLAAQQ